MEKVAGLLAVLGGNHGFGSDMRVRPIRQTLAVGGPLRKLTGQILLPRFRLGHIQILRVHADVSDYKHAESGSKPDLSAAEARPREQPMQEQAEEQNVKRQNRQEHSGSKGDDRTQARITQSSCIDGGTSKWQSPEPVQPGKQSAAAQPAPQKHTPKQCAEAEAAGQQEPFPHAK